MIDAMRLSASRSPRSEAVSLDMTGAGRETVVRWPDFEVLVLGRSAASRICVGKDGHS